MAESIIKFLKIREVKTPTRGFPTDAGIDFYVPKFNPSFIKDHFDLWYESDKNYFERAPKINLQGTADLVIIDGGEYCGFSDYEQSLLLKPTYLYLDDIRTQKTDKALEHALANDYDLLFKDDARNGFAVLRRKGASSNLMSVR
jgi:hypothetical protein